MNKKNKLPIIGMIGIILVLMSAFYWGHQTSKNVTTSTVSNVSSTDNLFQFLLNIIGIGNHRTSAGGTSSGTNTSNQNNPVFGSTLPGKNPLNGQALQGTTEQGANTAQGKNSPENNPEINGANHSGIDIENNSETTKTNNPDDNATYNTEYNSEINSESGMGTDLGNNINNSAENNTGTNAENNSGNNSEVNSATNLITNSENTAGDNSGNTPGDNSGDNSGSNSGGNSGSNTGNSNQSNLPTINPIPSNSKVSQSIARQNQQNDTLAAMLAAREALVIPVQQQAQATKYQTVTSQSIPPVSTTPAPADVVEKVKSKLIAVTH
ncbi:MAG: hypothetical protein HQL12_03830 [Candidatus Omnitrophica bacterium]|nr:hypothetical protein [Candidatus Omnitrophota bacterium]